MKSIYFILAGLFLTFTACKDKEQTEIETSIDSTAVQQDTVQTVNDTTSYDTISTEAPADTASAETNVNLPDKMSATTKVIPGEKGKFSLAETKWRLTELNGKSVDQTTRRDYFINFDSDSGRFRAYVGCNSIAGNYFMKASNKLGFTNVIATRKACDNMDVERNFFNNLQKVDNYMMEDGNRILHLHIGKKAAAKFEAIR